MLADIRYVEAVGCEAFSRMIYEYVEVWLASYNYDPRVILESVEVKEHQGNSAICRKRYDYEVVEVAQKVLSTFGG